MKKIYVLFGVGCILFAIRIIIEATRLRLGSLKAPGAGFWPFVTITAFLIFSVLYLVGVIRSKRETAKVSQGKIKWPKPLITMVSLVLYALLIERIGFILSTFLLMLVLFRVDTPQRWGRVVAGAVGSSIAMYVIFDWWLRVGLPRSPWESF